MKDIYRKCHFYFRPLHLDKSHGVLFPLMWRNTKVIFFSSCTGNQKILNNSFVFMCSANHTVASQTFCLCNFCFPSFVSTQRGIHVANLKLSCWGQHPVHLKCRYPVDGCVRKRSDLYHRADLPSSSHRCTARARCRCREHSRDTANTRHRADPASRSYTCNTQQRGRLVFIVQQ